MTKYEGTEVCKLLTNRINIDVSTLVILKLSNFLGKMKKCQLPKKKEKVEF